MAGKGKASRGPDGLTEKERKFVASYRGNAVEAARLAGYREPAAHAHALLKRRVVIEALRQRLEREQEKHPDPFRLTRQEWEERLTEIIRDGSNPLADRLRASEQFAKGQAWLTERREHEVKATLESLVLAARKPATEPAQ